MSAPSSPIRAPKPEPTCPGAPRAKKHKAERTEESGGLDHVLVVNDQETGDPNIYLIPVDADAPTRLAGLHRRLGMLHAGLKTFRIAVNNHEHQDFWDDDDEGLEEKHKELMSYFADRFTEANRATSTTFDVAAIFVLSSV